MPSRCPKCSGCGPGRQSRLLQLGAGAETADYVVALAGNPNTGKSTVFNALTGLRQHTGNWPGKTVTRAEGGYQYEGKSYKLVDLPGTYSLMAASTDEEVARNFILFGQPNVTLIVVDASRLERNLNLVLQVLGITDRAVLCLNLIDEARRHGLEIDVARLSEELGIPVVATSARYGRGIDELLAAIHRVATGRTVCRPRQIETTQSPVLTAALARLQPRLEEAFPALPNARWVALRLLDGDRRVSDAIGSGELESLYRESQAGQSEWQADREKMHPDTTGVASVGQAVPDKPVGQAVPDKNNPPALPAQNALGARQTDTVPPEENNANGEPAASTPGRDVVELASSLRWDVGPNFHQSVVETIYTEAAGIADQCVRRTGAGGRLDWERMLDWLFTSRWTGFPIMILMLAVVLWITVSGANYPSKMLSGLLVDTIHPWLKNGAAAIGVPWWISGLLIDGMYLATAWVVSVMLPPMAIFFPLFTLLEDFGYLPRVAFNLDSAFRRVGAHGKQALTLCMGFGCNAAGVVATRVIDSPRERLIAIVTNNFSLCNGRWPTQILIATIFLGALVPPYLAGFVSAMAVVGVALLGVLFALGASWLLSRTLLRGEASTFSLELPPYRPPRILQTLYTSLVDRTIFVLWRAVLFALPAGAAIWLVANVNVAGESLAVHFVRLADPAAVFIGLNGVILLAYIVAIPANEIVIPTVLMLTVATAHAANGGAGTGVMFETTESSTADILQTGGWTLLTGVNLMLFSLLHNPCSTTIYTIYKETGSIRWAAVATLLPLAIGIVVCLMVAQVWRLFVPV